jgi:hypothetical protein
MQPDDPKIRDFLAAALRGEDEPWPANWDDAAASDDIAAAAIFHGIAGLLVEKAGAIGDWPSRLADRLHDHARAQAMWELRHRQNLIALLDMFDEQAIEVLILKGTATAYDLYETPSTRSRGDSDLFIAEKDVPKAKAVLTDLGYSDVALGGVTPEFALQQAWTLALADGGSHSVDLHWQVMNAPSLKNLFSFKECYASARSLPRLSPRAKAMDRVRLLIHTCLHRAMQNNAPYFVDARTYYEPGRLISNYDIHLLATALHPPEWSSFRDLAETMGVARACLDGLRFAQSSFGTASLQRQMRGLEELAGKDRRSEYFVRSHPLSRAWQDVRSIPGLSRKLRYVLSRVVTTEDFLRAKYPRMAGRPLPLLYGRRLLDLVRRGRNAS